MYHTKISENWKGGSFGGTQIYGPNDARPGALGTAGLHERAVEASLKVKLKDRCTQLITRRPHLLSGCVATLHRACTG